MTDTVLIPNSGLWSDIALALNHNTDEVNSGLAQKLVNSDVKLQSTYASTTGDTTINKPMGRVLFVTGGTSITVTNSLVTANSNVFCSVLAADTAAIKNVIPAAGSFSIVLTAGASAQLAVGFMVVNPA